MRRYGIYGVWLLCGWLVVGCGTPRPAREPDPMPDPYFQRMITSGHAAFERGDVVRAAELYANAWTRAQVMDRPQAMGAAAHNLALCNIALGHWPEAQRLLRAARAELERGGEPVIDTWVLEAEVLRHLGQTDLAWDATEEALTRIDGRRAWRTAEIQVRSLRALMALDQDDPTTAQAEFERAESILFRRAGRRVQARLAEVRGRLAWANDDPARAAEAFDEEARLYRVDGRFPDMARALHRAGRAHERTEAPATAADRYFRAARHYAARANDAEALRLLERALPLLKTVEDPELTTRIADLVEAVLSRMEDDHE